MSVDARPDANASEPSEKRRLQQLNETYSSSPYYRKIWRQDSAAARFMAERKWTLIRSILQLEGVDPRAAWILDLGVGSGTDGPPMKDLAIRPDRFVGLDLLDRWAREARKTNPWMNTLAGDAGSLPFARGRFDLIYQSTMLSSVPDPGRRMRIFREIARVLAPGGMFLSYDTRYPNPLNPHTRPLRKAELRSAFPGWRMKVWSTTAIPQLQRALAPLSLTACHLLEGIPFLRSHLMVAVRKT
jgi:SAM-dependent methyltransferase